MITLLAKQLSEVLTNKPQRRSELCDRLHCDDRSLRRAVNELRELGFNVASNSQRAGYWYGNEADKERTISEYTARGIKDLRIAEAIKRGPDLGQLEVEV